nr:PREDICTED: trypsin-7-like [Bemisia tabaci]
MALIYVLVCISMNVLLVTGQKKDDSVHNRDNIDDLLAEVYGTSSTESSLGQDHNGQDHNMPQQGCECVPYYQCNDKNNTFNTDGVDLIDIRIRDGPCVSYMDVCCAERTVDPEHPDVHPVTSPKTPTHPYERSGCGHRNEEGIGFRITGATNNEAQFGEFPWMVAILKEEPCNCNSSHMLNVYQCGGSLISPAVVLTAAHCVHQKQAESLKIRAGEWDTQTKSELFPHYDRRVRNIILHEQYYAGALHNDVALLILDEPLEYKENIDVTCLPHQDESFDEHDCFATGWGKDVFGKEGKYQVILKKVQLPTVHRTQCQAALRETRLGAHFKLHESFICAGGERGKDTCKGDGGSPLVCPIRSRPGYYAQAGIVAWGIGCGEDGTPGVYVNVAKFRNWIDNKIEQHHLDTSAYSYS